MADTRDHFSRFVRVCWRRLHLVAQKYAGSGEDADDLVQETLRRAWENFKPDEGHHYRPGWLFVILRHVAIDMARSERVRIRLFPVDHNELTELFEGELSEPFAPLPSLTEGQFREFLDDNVASALDALEPHHREVILLSVLGELNYREISDVLECPVGTVMSRMARARRALRERLGEYARASGWSVENPR